MNNPIRVYYNPDFIASCITALFDDPFWDEDNDGKVRELSDANRLTYLSSTLPSLGFYNLPIGNKLVPIQVNGNIAREINQKDLRDFVIYLLNRVPNGNWELHSSSLQVLIDHLYGCVADLDHQVLWRGLGGGSDLPIWCYDDPVVLIPSAPVHCADDLVVFFVI